MHNFFCQNDIYISINSNALRRVAIFICCKRWGLRNRLWRVAGRDSSPEHVWHLESRIWKHSLHVLSNAERVIHLARLSQMSTRIRTSLLWLLDPLYGDLSVVHVWWRLLVLVQLYTERGLCQSEGTDNSNCKFHYFDCLLHNRSRLNRP